MKNICFTLFIILIVTALVACSNGNTNKPSRVPVAHPTKDSTSHEGVVVLVEIVEDLAEAMADD